MFFWPCVGPAEVQAEQHEERNVALGAPAADLEAAAVEPEDVDPGAPDVDPGRPEAHKGPEGGRGY